MGTGGEQAQPTRPTHRSATEPNCSPRRGPALGGPRSRDFLYHVITRAARATRRLRRLSMPPTCMGGRVCGTGSHRHCHTELHSHAEAQGGHKPRCRRAAALCCLALSRRHTRAADPPMRGDRSCRPPSCFRQTPATRVRRSSRVLHTHEAVANRTRGEWMGEHGMVAGMGSRAPR